MILILNFKLIFQSDYSLIIDLQEPDNVSYSERKKQRIENEKFNEDHYLADIYDNDLLEEVILKYEPFWNSIDKIPEKSIQF